MREFIERAKQLGIQFDYETSVRTAYLFDLGEAITIERARLEEVELPTCVHDDIMGKIDDWFRAEAAKYKGHIQEPMPNVSNSS